MFAPRQQPIPEEDEDDDEDDDDPFIPHLSTWTAMPIHAKLACMFMQGMSIRYALDFIRRICAVIPPEHRPSHLLAWIRAAATVSPAGNSSALHPNTSLLLHHMSDPETEDWYYSVVARWAPNAQSVGETVGEHAAVTHGGRADGDPTVGTAGDASVDSDGVNARMVRLLELLST
jgi:hypothetical protein